MRGWIPADRFSRSPFTILPPPRGEVCSGHVAAAPDPDFSGCRRATPASGRASFSQEAATHPGGWQRLHPTAQERGRCRPLWSVGRSPSRRCLWRPGHRLGLDQLMAEANKLRRAPAALGGGDGSAPADSARRRTRAGVRTESPSRSAATAGSSSRGSSASVSEATRGRSAGRRSGTCAAQGQTNSAVLAALSSGEPMTAGEVAAATGLGRAVCGRHRDCCLDTCRVAVAR